MNFEIPDEFLQSAFKACGVGEGYLAHDQAEQYTVAAHAVLGQLGEKVKVQGTLPACPVSKASLCLPVSRRQSCKCPKEG